MGKLGLVVSLAVIATSATACQPMYGQRPERIKNPPILHPTKVADPDPVAVVYVDDCTVRTTPPVAGAPPRIPRRDPTRSDELVAKADSSATAADHTTEPTKKSELLIDSIREYGAALQKDPFNAGATLKLALAYDRVYRRGCALAMLGRLTKLAGHPTFERAATDQIDDVENHKSWFGGYRKDALRAVGR